MRFYMLAALIAGVVATAPAQEVFRATIRTLPSVMKYDRQALRVKPGQSVELTLKNDDQLPHNLVVLRDSGDFMPLAQKAWALGEKGPDRQWIPEDPRVLAHTPLVDPAKEGMVTFKAPDRECELDYVCTFPGHAMVMNGRLTVSNAPAPGLSQLTCMVFKGSWDHLPDFVALPAEHKVRVDEVNDNQVDVAVAGMSDHFGLLFDGTLTAPADGEYAFMLASDDGSRLSIDDRVVVDNDGIHPATQKRGKVMLKAGLHRFQLAYFEQAGQEGLALAWKGPGFEKTWLSKAADGESADNSDLVLSPKDGRPVIYRGFLDRAQGSHRMIAVGTPEELNYAFDQDQLRLGLMWKGEFLDVGRHWTGRGDGAIAPQGYAVQEWPAGEGFAQLAGEAAPWPELDATARARHSKFRGYALDTAGTPTFRYQTGGVEIEDALRPAGQRAQATDTLVRTLTLRAPAGLDGFFFRAAVGDPLAAQPDGSFKVGESLTLVIKSSVRPLIRNQELLVPVPFNDGSARLVITYRWF